MYTTLIKPEELANLLTAADVRIFDVRHELAEPHAGLQAFRQSRIPGAVFLDMDHDLSGERSSTNGRHPLPEREAFHDLMVRAGVGEATQVVVYDAQRGIMASRLWWMLRWLGFANVAVLDGGWQAWQAAGLPVDETPLEHPVLPGAAVQPLGLQPPLSGSVDVTDVMKNLESPGFVLVDAREQARYLGVTEPLDPVAGHIPGALNRPASGNLDPAGSFKDAATLRNEFSAVLGDTPPGRIVHQCGSGISACHNLLAMEHAGLKGSRLYPGSWSEWCSDPVRPVA